MPPIRHGEHEGTETQVLTVRRGRQVWKAELAPAGVGAWESQGASLGGGLSGGGGIWEVAP